MILKTVWIMMSTDKDCTKYSCKVKVNFLESPPPAGNPKGFVCKNTTPYPNPPSPTPPPHPHTPNPTLIFLGLAHMIFNKIDYNNSGFMDW